MELSQSNFSAKIYQVIYDRRDCMSRRAQKNEKGKKKKRRLKKKKRNNRVGICTYSQYV